MSRPPNPGGAPVSYKTVPGRHRTQKWNVAKQYDYSGDDWGGSDGYDDYEGDGQQEQSAPPPLPPQPNFPSQLPSQLPSQQQKTGRQMSFDRGDIEEQRQFRAGQMSLPPGGSSDRSGGVSPARSAVSATSSGGKKSSDFQRPPTTRLRDFTNPDQVPPPLYPASRGSPALSSSGFAPPPLPSTAGNAAAFPPRKSSISSGSPAPEVLPSAAKQEKDLPQPPFIRPSDIYKRMAAEQERERKMSESSSRPSMESIQRETDSSNNLSTPGWQQRPLSSVEEGPLDSSREEGRQQADFGEPHGTTATSTISELPRVSGISSFGSDWLQGSEDDISEQTPTSAQTITQTTTTSAIPSYMHGVSAAPNAAPDPAAEILAERTHETPISAIGRQPDALAHQPSQGYRSVVNKAFDHGARANTGVLTRDNSQSTSGVSRSDSASTSAISPIMSRVPSSATAQARQQQEQQERDASVPTITEEPANRWSSGGTAAPTLRQTTPTASNSGPSERDTAALAGVGVVAAGAAAVGVVAGYRRSFDPPESANSPAHTPLVQSGDERRFSDGLAAEADESSKESVVPGATEETVVTEPAATQRGLAIDTRAAASVPPTESFTSQLPRTGRARAGTDYSMRESDLAEAINNSGSPSNEQSMSPVDAAREEKAEQKLFLQTHAGTPTAASFAGSDIARTASPAMSASGRGSPARSRVKEIAGKYQDLHNASSQTSLGGSAKSTNTWSRVGSEENLSAAAKDAGAGFQPTAPSRQGTGSTWNTDPASESVYSREQDETSSPTAISAVSGSAPPRPWMEREASFRPQLPGGWVSYREDPSTTATPAVEHDEGEMLQASTYEQRTPRASYEGQQPASEEVDLTPTTKKIPLQSASPETAVQSHFAQAAEAGTALGAALLASVGIGHQTRDFGSTEPAQPVEQPELQSKPPIGQLGYLSAPQRPELNRGDTSATDVTDVTSATNSVPPTPPEKDTPSMERSSDYYFTVTPLRTAKSREESPITPVTAAPVTAPQRPGVSPAMSTWARPGDTESDRLRKEIVRSLDTTHTRQNAQEDDERTQDALDAPDNAQRAAEGGSALPAAEIKDGRPGLLDQRFSWEDQDVAQDGFTPPQDTTPAIRTSVEKALPAPPAVVEPEPEGSPEIKPEMPYERPRSRGLHIMNADSDDDLDELDKPAGPVQRLAEESLDRGSPVTPGPVSPLTSSQENLHLTSLANAFSTGPGGLSAPSPLDEEGRGSVRLPSYYLLDIPGLERTRQQDDDAAATAPEVADEEQPALKSLHPQLEESEDMDVAPQTKANEETPSPTSPTGKQKIPPFREILAIKSPTDRIRTYDETRQTFADTDTGLSGWLSGMLAQHPEHANLSTPQNDTSLSIVKGHKSSPSIAKFTRQFSSSQPAGDGQHLPEMIPQRTPTKGFGDGDKLQQRGKDLMKNASVLGGKAQAGAKGLFAKGRSRFGSTRDGSRGSGSGSKDLSPAPPSVSAPVSRSTTSSSPIPRVLDRSDPSTILQPVPMRISQSNSPLPSPSLTGPQILGPILSRAHNRTPSSLSSSTGNPLSRTLSRLRDRSRSKSASRSRPTSMILISSDLEGIRDEDAHTAAAAAAGGKEGLLGPSAAPADDGTSRDGMPSAISPWAEPDSDPFLAAQGADAGWEEQGDGVPARLGVLPSPTAPTFASDIHSPPGTSRGTEAPDTEFRALGEESEDVQGESAAKSAEDLDSEVSRSDVERDVAEGETAPMSSAAEADDSEDLYATTPVAATFPAVDRGDLHDDDEGEDRIEDTPRAVQGTWGHDTAQLAAPVVGLVSMHGEEKEGNQAEAEENAAGERAAGQKDADVPLEGAAPDSVAGLVNENDGAPLPDDVAEDVFVDAKSMQHDDEIPSINDDIDKKSQISAEDGEVRNAADDFKPALETSSRRSSVSSLGRYAQQDAVVQHPPDDHEEPVMSSQAVPAGPIGTIASAASTETAPNVLAAEEGQDPTDRTYLTRLAIPRPLSFEPLERDQSGLAKETLTTSPQRAGGADLEDDWAAATTFNTTTLTRHRKVSIPTPDRKSKRLSAFFKENVTPTKSAEEDALPDITPSERGVEDLLAFQIDEPTPELPRELSQADTKRSRRRSGIFDAFRRSPSNSKASSKARNSSERVAPPVGGAVDTPPLPPMPALRPHATTVKETPQRASTTATAPEKKKKRFSGIGSLFGRSSTTSHKTESSKKLVKSQIPQGEPQSKKRPPRLESPDLHDEGADIPAPMHAWYAPTDEPGFSRYPPPQQIYVDTRRSNDARAATHSGVPEAFRPVNDSYTDKYSRAIGPPEPSVPGSMYSHSNSHINGVEPRGSQDSYPQQQYAAEHQTATTAVQGRHPSIGYPSRQSSYGQPDRRVSYDNQARQPPYESGHRPFSYVSESRQASYGNGNRQPSYGLSSRQSSFGQPSRHRSFGPGDDSALSPQISGQSEWERIERQHRNSLPSISPVQTGASVPPGRNDPRLGSLREDISHRPTQSYDERHFAPKYSMPPQSGTGTSSSRSSHYARQRRSRPSGTGGEPGDSYAPLSPSDMGRPYQGFADVSRDYGPSMQYGQAVTTDTPYSQRPVAYNVPVTSSAQSRGGVQTGGQILPQNGPSGYLFGQEDRVEMRGVSYPGQEWAPTQWE